MSGHPTLGAALHSLPGRQWATVNLSEDRGEVHVVPCWEGWHVLTARCRCRPTETTQPLGVVVTHNCLDEREAS